MSHPLLLAAAAALACCCSAGRALGTNVLSLPRCSRRRSICLADSVASAARLLAFATVLNDKCSIFIKRVVPNGSRHTSRSHRPRYASVRLSLSLTHPFSPLPPHFLLCCRHLNITLTRAAAARRALASGRHEVLHAMALSPSVWACGTAAPPTSSCIVLYCPLDGPLFLALRVLARGRSFIIDPCAQVDAPSRRELRPATG